MTRWFRHKSRDLSRGADWLNLQAQILETVPKDHPYFHWLFRHAGIAYSRDPETRFR